MKKQDNRNQTENFSVMKWLRGVRDKFADEYYNNPDKFLSDMKKIKLPKGVKITK